MPQKQCFSNEHHSESRCANVKFCVSYCGRMLMKLIHVKRNGNVIKQRVGHSAWVFHE